MTQLLCFSSEYTSIDGVGFRIRHHTFKMAAVTSFLEKAEGLSLQNLAGMYFTHVNTHRLTELNFQFDLIILSHQL